MDTKIKSEKLVSILMATYSESESVLLQSVESICKQTYKNIELILVDDGNDNIKFLNQKINISNFKIIKNEGKGLVDALNTGLNNISGDLVARMDADDIAHPDRIRKSIEFLNAFDLDFVATDMNFIDSQNNIINRGNLRTLYGEKLTSVLKRINIMNHPSWLLKREVYIYNKGYLPFYKNEDWNFVLRSIENGFKLGFLGEPLLNYRIGPNKITTSSGLYRSNFTFNNLRQHGNRGSINKYKPEEDNKRFELINHNTVLKREHFIDFLFKNVNQKKISLKLSNFLDYWTYVYCLNIALNKLTLGRIQKDDN